MYVKLNLEPPNWVQFQKEEKNTHTNNQVKTKIPTLYVEKQ